MQVWIIRRVKDRVIMDAYDNSYDANKTATRIENTFHEFVEVITVNVRESEDKNVKARMKNNGHLAKKWQFLLKKYGKWRKYQ